MEGVCCEGDSYLLQRKREQKVFGVKEFHLCYKKSGSEGVCHMGVSHLLQREWERKAFVILREFHICYNERGRQSGPFYILGD